MKNIVVSPDQFDFRVITQRDFLRRHRGNQGAQRKNLRYYRNIISAFDIETTQLDDIQQSYMYIWQWQIEQYTVIGRTWSEWLEFAEKVNACYEQDNQFLVVFVHNLSFEFQFLSGVVHFNTNDVFAIEAHKVLKATWKHIEFRCSYLHSNRSLKSYLEVMEVEHQKLSGDDFGYNLIRFPDTELKPQELQYCINDVVGLCEAITKDMLLTGDNLYTFPLTSTGYPRRDAKQALTYFEKVEVRKTLPDYETYKMLRAAFVGGNVHANRYYADTIIKDVHSVDRSSSYPDVICNCKFPVTPFETAPKINGFDELLHFMMVRKRACLFTFICTNVRLRNEFHTPCPYLMFHKCERIDMSTVRLDNGRVLSAGYVETTMTDIDFRIFLQQYDWDSFEVLELKYAKYGFLPETFTDCVKEYYRQKTQLKGDEEKTLEYQLVKAMLNSLYGMMAQNPVHTPVNFKDGEWLLATPEEGQTVDQFYSEILAEHNKLAFLAYQWGVWVTAWARWRLQAGIDLVGDDFIYCDTDSVKYIGDHDFTAYNQMAMDDSTRSGAYAKDRKGKRHYMGVFEFEGTYKEFVTAGAKRYAYTDDAGKLHVTVSGVSKSVGARYLEQHGGLLAFSDGFTFEESGKKEVYYTNRPLEEIEVMGHKVEICSSVYLRDVAYTMGLSDDYRNLLDIIKYNHVETFDDWC